QRQHAESDKDQGHAFVLAKAGSQSVHDDSSRVQLTTLHADSRIARAGVERHRVPDDRADRSRNVLVYRPLYCCITRVTCSSRSLASLSSAALRFSASFFSSS